MPVLKGAVIAVTPTGEKSDRHFVWLCLPTTAGRAERIARPSANAATTFRENKGQSRIWRCVARIGTVDVDPSGLVADEIATRVMLVLQRLSADKELRQALRITAWLAGRDLSALFGRSSILFREQPSGTETAYKQALWLAKCMNEGITGRRIIDNLDPKTVRVMWSLAKLADRAPGTRYEWVQRKLRNAAKPFERREEEVICEMLRTATLIERLFDDKSKSKCDNAEIRSKAWRLVAGAAIETLEIKR